MVQSNGNRMRYQTPDRMPESVLCIRGAVRDAGTVLVSILRSAASLHAAEGSQYGEMNRVQARGDVDR